MAQRDEKLNVPGCADVRSGGMQLSAKAGLIALHLATTEHQSAAWPVRNNEVHSRFESQIPSQFDRAFIIIPRIGWLPCGAYVSTASGTASAPS